MTLKVCVQEQTPRSQRHMIETVSFRIGRYVHPVDEHLPPVDFCKRLTQIHRMGTAAFHFRAHQFHSGFDRINDFVIVPCLPVSGKRFVFAEFLFFCHSAYAMYCFALASNSAIIGWLAEVRESLKYVSRSFCCLVRLAGVSTCSFTS